MIKNTHQVFTKHINLEENADEKHKYQEQEPFFLTNGKIRDCKLIVNKIPVGNNNAYQ